MTCRGSIGSSCSLSANHHPQGLQSSPAMYMHRAFQPAVYTVRPLLIWGQGIQAARSQPQMLLSDAAWKGPAHCDAQPWLGFPSDKMATFISDRCVYQKHCKTFLNTVCFACIKARQYHLQVRWRCCSSSWLCRKACADLAGSADARQASLYIKAVRRNPLRWLASLIAAVGLNELHGSLHSLVELVTCV